VTKTKKINQTKTKKYNFWIQTNSIGIKPIYFSKW